MGNGMPSRCRSSKPLHRAAGRTGRGYTGTITEPDSEEADGVLRALVGGARTGSSVAWVKQYDGSGRVAHAVRYAGAVNANATEIRGRWQLDSFSGGFTMTREKFSEAELEESEARLLPLPQL